MKTLILALLTCCAARAAAMEEAVITGPGAEATPAQEEVKAPEPPKPPFKPSPEARLAVLNLALLLERGGEIPQERLAALTPQLAAFNTAAEKAIGEDLLAEAAAEHAKKSLQKVRTALQVWFGDNGGKYPPDLAALTPSYLAELPELRLPGHPLTDKVTVINSKKYDAALEKAVGDSGGWLYFSGDESANRGLLVIDCSHRSPAGQEYFKY
jgi:hypothetical protein